VLGLLPPALPQGGVRQAVLVIVAYSVINVMIQSLLQPKFMGDAVGLSVTPTFLPRVFWSFVIGPLGALLAVPPACHQGAPRGRRPGQPLAQPADRPKPAR
jgi:AI-2 transport protein TqsA